MISHSSTSTMVLGVTPVTFSKLGNVAHPDNMHDTKRIDTNERMTAPNARNKGHAYHRWITIAVSPAQQMGNFAALELWVFWLRRCNTIGRATSSDRTTGSCGRPRRFRKYLCSTMPSAKCTGSRVSATFREI